MRRRLAAPENEPGLNSSWRLVGRLFISLALASYLAVSPVHAFDTGPHFDLTRDALTAEGFSETALNVAQVTNWMVDFYEQASQNPYSGPAVQ